jgi:hypothetical protein
MLQGQTHSVRFFRSFSSLGTQRAHFPKLQTLNHGNTLVQLLHCPTLSSCQLTQLLPPLHSCFCRNENRAARSGIIGDFRASLREFLDPVVNRLRDKHFPPQEGNISLWISYAKIPFVHKNHTVEHCFSVVHPSSTVAILTAEPASEHAHARLLPRIYFIKK